MAAGQLSLTRRALLAGACAAPVAAGAALFRGHPELDDRDAPSPGRCIRGPDHGSSSPPALPHQDWTLKRVQGDGKGEKQWLRAFNRLREVEALLAEAAQTEDDEYYDRLGGRRDAAVQRLLLTPAPDTAALALKLDLLVAEQAWEMPDGESCLAALQRDAHQFARG